jgi:hypothetical protein
MARVCRADGRAPASTRVLRRQCQIFLRSENLRDEYRQLNENYGCCARAGGWVVG